MPNTNINDVAVIALPPATVVLSSAALPTAVNGDSLLPTVSYVKPFSWHIRDRNILRSKF